MLIGITLAVMGFPIADRLAAICVGILVARIGVSLNIDAIKGLMDSSVDMDVLKSVYAIAKTTPGVEGVCYLRGRSVGESGYLEVCVYVDGSLKVLESDLVAETIRKRILSEVEHVTDVVVPMMPVEVRKKSMWAGRRKRLAVAAE